MSLAPRRRTDVRPLPEDWDDDDPMTLVEAEAVFGSRFPLRVSTMRTEIHRGRLPASYVGGVYYVTPSSLKALFKCHVKPKARVSTSAGDAPTPGRGRGSQTAGSSVTERAKSARDAALSAWGMQSEN